MKQVKCNKLCQALNILLVDHTLEGYWGINPAILMCSTKTMLKQDAFSSLLLCPPADILQDAYFSGEKDMKETGKLLWEFYKFMLEPKYGVLFWRDLSLH